MPIIEDNDKNFLNWHIYLPLYRNDLAK